MENFRSQVAEAIRRRRRGVGRSCRRPGSSLWSLSSLREHGEREYKTQRPFFATLILPPKSSVVRSKTRSRVTGQTNKPASQPANTRRRLSSCTRSLARSLAVSPWPPIGLCTSDNSHITITPTRYSYHYLFPFFQSTPFVEYPPPSRQLYLVTRTMRQSSPSPRPSNMQRVSYDCLPSLCGAARGCNPIHPIQTLDVASSRARKPCFTHSQHHTFLSLFLRHFPACLVVQCLPKTPIRSPRGRVK